MESIYHLASEVVPVKYQCTYCNSTATTRDHVPPKVFLNPPLQNCRTVPACQNCNQKFGKDDEFFAYFFEFMRSIEHDIDGFERKKIQKIYEHSTSIEDRIFNSLRTTDSNPPLAYIYLENKRIDSFLRRLSVALIFLDKNERVSLSSGWTTSCFFAKMLYDRTYEILGMVEKKSFHDDVSWCSDVHCNSGHRKVFFKIRDIFFAQASWKGPGL